MKKYFVARDGIQKGPWSLQEITNNVQKKILSWNDYIYDDKTSEWLFLFEFPQLTDVFNRSFKKPVQQTKLRENLDQLRDRLWYILKQEEYYGPFSSLEMIQMLQSKTLFEFDFVWRQEQDSWKRLADIDEFKPARVKELYENSLGQESETHTPFFRRRFARVHYQCELLIHNNHKVYSAKSVEISSGGACFQIEGVSFSIDSEVHLHFKPGQDVPAFNAVCKVVSVQGNKYGVSFSSISSAAADSIAKFTKKAA